MPFDLSQALGNPALQEGAVDTLRALLETGTEQSEDYRRQQRAVQAAGAAMMGGVPGMYGAAMPAIGRGLQAGQAEYGRLENRDLELREARIDRQLKAQIEAIKNSIALGKTEETRRHNLMLERLSGEKNNIQREKAANARQRNSNYQINVNPNTGMASVFDPMTAAIGVPNQGEGGGNDLLGMDEFVRQGQAARQGAAPPRMPNAGQMPMQAAPAMSPMAAPAPDMSQLGPMQRILAERLQAAATQTAPQMQQQSPVPSPMLGNRAIVQGPPGAVPGGALQQGTYRAGAPMQAPVEEGYDEPGQDPFAGDVPAGTPGYVSGTQSPFGGKRELLKGNTIQGGVTTVPIDPRTGSPTGPVQEVLREYGETEQKGWHDAETALRFVGTMLPLVRKYKDTGALKQILQQKIYEIPEGGRINYFQMFADSGVGKYMNIKDRGLQQLYSEIGQLGVYMSKAYAGSRLGTQLMKRFDMHLPRFGESVDQSAIKLESLAGNSGLLIQIMRGLDKAAADQVEGSGALVTQKDVGWMLGPNGDDATFILANGEVRNAMKEVGNLHLRLVDETQKARKGLVSEEEKEQLWSQAYDAVFAFGVKQGRVAPDEQIKPGVERLPDGTAIRPEQRFDYLNLQGRGALQ